MNVSYGLAPHNGTAAATAVAEPSAPARHPVVDACSLVYDDAGWRAYLNRLGENAPEYLDVFSSSFCRYFGASHPAYREALAVRWQDAVDVLLPPGRPPFDLAAHLADRRRQGVTAEFAMGSAERLPDGRTVNTWLLETVREVRDRIHVWAGISLRDPAAALREVEVSLAAGASGLCVIPFLDGTDPADPRFAPVWDAAATAGLPVWLHTGHHFARSHPSGLGSWRTVEALAARHRELLLVAGHAGWPDVRETLLTAARHPGVHLEFSSHRPRHMAGPGSGWEPLLHHARGLARDRVMFGTSTWVNPGPTGPLANELAELPLPEDVVTAWLSGNAEALVARSAGKRRG
ncbi:amidohydrolase family protein [Streptomyces californicus]|uniref:amidohydrolase family protein n=1 Tax=Streptomyces californicus TaxID=67351 RepID=UPI00296F5982|nr:amidohydrolase family protein [Streptomyces californicus]MDW4914832.1 amidohydrolase family protein [Streptomyces californicus]